MAGHSDPHATQAHTISDNVARVRARVRESLLRSGRPADPLAVRIIAVTKYMSDDDARAVLHAGVRDLGENRVDQLVRRAANPADASLAPRWHFLGRVQSRDVPTIARHAFAIHSLTSTRAARRLDPLCPTNPLTDVFVQVNVDDDPSKAGLAPHQVAAFLDELPASVRACGLMTMPALAPNPEQSRRAFATLRELRDALAPTVAGRHPLTRLSMGTSQDYAVAVDEGATDIRIGRILTNNAASRSPDVRGEHSTRGD